MKTLRSMPIAWTFSLLLIGLLGGCAGNTSSSSMGETSDLSAEPNQKIVEEIVEDEPIVSSSVPPSPGFTEENLAFSDISAVKKKSKAPIFFLDIPFNFDKSSLREDALTYVEVNAIRIQDEEAGKVLLEGRADEIGTLEYNFVLGERRARAVKEHLIRLGFDPDTFVITSYGKVKPLCKDHNAECWQVNRSVHFESE